MMKKLKIDTNDGGSTTLKLRADGNVSVSVTDYRRMPVEHHIEEFSNPRLGSVWMDMVLDYLTSEEA